jgi:DNA-binding NtrC family response regulator
MITGTEPPTARIANFARLAHDLRHYLALPAFGPPPDPAHVLALFFQVRRAFHFTLEHILGGSAPAAHLRATVWQAVFTRDMRRYRRALHDRMHDVTTLIVGPSGTGKELVARAIGLSRYIPFDPRAQRFVEDFREGFFPLSISALSATLVESELFGHKKGAFTGAAADRKGWLEVCPRFGTVFLDEVADIDAAIQVKLLRVLEARTFQRVGDTRDRRFEGKIVAATNRDLATEMQTGRFRPDLYYRLCSVVVDTPTLAAQLRDDPGELGHLLRFIAQRVAGDEEADALAQEAESAIATHLGKDYTWPGNVRELEQCVRNVMIRGEYRPARPSAPTGPQEELAQPFLAGSLTAEELLRRYCTLVYAQTGSYQETARRLALDRRTVKEKIDPALLEQLTRQPGPAARQSIG